MSEPTSPHPLDARSHRRLSGLVWAAVWMGGTLLVIRPGISTEISSFFGIGRGAGTAARAPESAG